MKKIITLILAVCLIVGATVTAMLVTSADGIEEKRLYLSPEQSEDWNGGSTFTKDGGYYIKDALLNFGTGDDDVSQNGVTAIINPLGNGSCLWATWYKLLVAKGLLYLHYTIPENNTGLYELTLCYALGYDATKDLPQEIEPGEHVIDLTMLAPEDDGAFCVYVIIRCGAGETVVINDFYLSNYGGEGDTPFDTVVPETKEPGDTEEPGDTKEQGEQTPIAVDGKIKFTCETISDGKRYVDGVMYVDPGFKDGSFVNAEEDISENGITVFSEGKMAHSIWADVKDVAAQYRYLHYIIREENSAAIIRIGLGYSTGWDIDKLVLFDTTPGEHVVDLTTVNGFDDPDSGYFYFNICIDADQVVAIDELWMSETEPVIESSEDTETQPKDTEPPVVSTDKGTEPPAVTTDKAPEEAGKSNTGLIIGIAVAAVAVVAAVVGIVLGTKKKK